jgi:hypothetical protein
MSGIPTRAAYDRATPYAKGYMCYTYAEHPNSEIPRRCPYVDGTEGYLEFYRGVQQAVLDAQDSEE